MWMTYIKYMDTPQSAIDDIEKPTQDMIAYADFLTRKKYHSKPDSIMPDDNIKRIIQKYDLG
jgi:hypothetical protein